MQKAAPQYTLALKPQHLPCAYVHAVVCLQHAPQLNPTFLGTGPGLTQPSSPCRVLWRPALCDSKRLVAASAPVRIDLLIAIARWRAAGRISHVRGRDPSFQCPYLRVAWSYCEFGDLRKGMQRLGAALRDCADDGRESVQMSGKT